MFLFRKDQGKTKYKIEYNLIITIFLFVSIDFATVEAIL